MNAVYDDLPDMRALVTAGMGAYGVKDGFSKYEAVKEQLQNHKPFHEEGLLITRCLEVLMEPLD